MVAQCGGAGRRGFAQTTPARIGAGTGVPAPFEGPLRTIRMDRRDQKSFRLRPMISFMISVVPP